MLQTLRDSRTSAKGYLVKQWRKDYNESSHDLKQTLTLQQFEFEGYSHLMPCMRHKDEAD